MWQPDYENTRDHMKTVLNQSTLNETQLYDRLIATALEFSGALDEISTLGEEIRQANASLDAHRVALSASMKGFSK